jgi:hypothetical protein
VNDLSHLSDATRGLIELSSEERIERVLQPHWIGYPESQRILKRLEELYIHPQVDRMPDLLLVGETNNGKTMIARRFEQQHPSSDGSDVEHSAASPQMTKY